MNDSQSQKSHADTAAHLKMSQDNPPTKQVKMIRPEINKHGSDQVITNPKKMTPLIDTVKTMENSLAAREDLDERGRDE